MTRSTGDQSSDSLMLKPILIRIVCHFFLVIFLLHVLVTFDYTATASMHKSMEVKQSNEIAATLFSVRSQFFFLHYE